MTYDPLKGRNIVLLLSIMSHVYEQPDERPVELSDLVERQQTYAAKRTISTAVAALAAQGAIRKAQDPKTRETRIWPTVLGRLWHLGDLNVPNLAEMFLEEDQPEQETTQ